LSQGCGCQASSATIHDHIDASNRSSDAEGVPESEHGVVVVQSGKTDGAEGHAGVTGHVTSIWYIDPVSSADYPAMFEDGVV
jgi:hypothetical protein